MATNTFDQVTSLGIQEERICGRPQRYQISHQARFSSSYAEMTPAHLWNAKKNVLTSTLATTWLAHPIKLMDTDQR